jgi:transposase InsO family protein
VGTLTVMVHLNPAQHLAAKRYNCERKHQSLDYQTPEKLFKKIV